MVYFPLGVGNHVDHVLCRDVGLGPAGRRAPLGDAGPDFVGRVSFYEDFPYAWWTDFGQPGDLAEELVALPAGLELEARYSDISEQMDRKAAGMRLYASQIKRLFESDQGMLDDLAGYHERIALAGRRRGLRRALLERRPALDRGWSGRGGELPGAATGGEPDGALVVEVWIAWTISSMQKRSWTMSWPARASVSASGWSGQQAGDGGGQRAGIVRRDQQAGLAVLDHLGDAADVRWQPPGGAAPSPPGSTIPCASR